MSVVSTTVVGARVSDGLGTDQYADVRWRDGVIEAITPTDGRQPPGDDHHGSDQLVDGRGRWLTPGLVDLHLHGAFGHSVTTAGGDEIGGMLAQLARTGVTAVQLSLVSASTERLADQLATLQTLPSGNGPSDARVLGVHLEGPFLATDQCGAHDPAVVRSPTRADLAVLAAAGDLVTMVTLAPELDGVLDLVRWLSERSIVAAVGHSAAGVADLDAAVAAGARHLTHLWSGQSALRRDGPWRVPGLIEASLASDVLTAEVIADGRHLPPTLLEIARRCLGDRLILVSDATEGAGMPEGYRYRLGTVDCEVAAGVGMVVGQAVFAGSTTLLPEMLRHIVVDLGWPPAEAVRMVTSVPAQVLRRPDLGRIEVGARADLALWDARWEVEQVWLNGTSLG